MQIFVLRKHRFYDSLSRLLSADYDNGATVYNYGYDEAGNMVNMNSTTRTYNAANQLIDDGTNSYLYDDNGNLWKTNSVVSHTWDRANRLLSHGGISYAYDGAGNRISQNALQYLLDLQPGLTLVLGDSDGNHFVHGLRGIHAQEDNPGNWEYMAQDGLGSVRGLVDDVAVVQSSMSYDPYGNPMGSYGAGFGFTGEQVDANDLLYLRARYYEPSLGVFSALDPLEFINRYNYVHNNPVNLIDPSGACVFAGVDTVACGELALWGIAILGSLLLSAQASSGSMSTPNFNFHLPDISLPNPADMIAATAALFSAPYNVLEHENLPSYFDRQAQMCNGDPDCLAALSYNQTLLQDSWGISSGGAVAAPPMPYPPGGLDPEELWKDISDLCGATLLSIIDKLTRTLEDRSRRRYRNDPEEFVGYHATSSVSVPSMLEGLRIVGGNYLTPLQLGVGFYVLRGYSESILRDFGMQAVGSQSGQATVCDVYAKGFSKMREGKYPLILSFNPATALVYTALYDYLTAPILGTRREMLGFTQVKFNPQTLWAVRVRNCHEL